jgi:Tfp pilus assembly protein PilF
MRVLIANVLIGLFVTTAVHASPPTAAQSDEVTTLLQQGNKAWSEQNMEQAEKDFRKAIELDPDSAQAHAVLAGFLQTMNRGTEAIEEYQTAITLDSENPKLFVALAISYLHQQKYGMAQAVTIEALRLDPEMANAKKLMQYIDAKEDMLDRAAKVDISDPAAVPGDSMPADYPEAKLPAGHPAPSAPAAH